MAANALYKQIYKNLREDILYGRIANGERLPSKRTLAEQQNVSVITVLNAYDRLIAEGYVKSEPRRGYFVSFPKERQLQIKNADFTDKPSHTKNYRYDFKTVAAAQEGFPFSSWAKLMREVLSEKDAKLLSAPDPKGVWELRCEIARLLGLSRGLYCSPEQIIIGAGSDYLINLVYQLLGRRSYAVEDPGYTKAALIYKNLGATVHYIGADEQGIMIQPLVDCASQVVHVAPSHNFPTGLVTTPKRRAELLSWVSADEERYIIEDDFENEFCYSGRRHASLSTMDTSERVIYMNTFTRTLAPSMRIGYIVLPPSLLTQYETKLAHCSCTVPTLEQYVLARFISDGSFERHVHRMRSIYKRRRDRLILALEREFGDKIQVIGHDAGVHVLGQLNEIALDTILDGAQKASVLLASLKDYCHSTTPSDALVFNFAGMSEDDIDTAITCLAKHCR